jgi:hypothetical protein
LRRLFELEGDLPAGHPARQSVHTSPGAGVLPAGFSPADADLPHTDEALAA